jgi:hypothetical protein
MKLPDMVIPGQHPGNGHPRTATYDVFKKRKPHEEQNGFTGNIMAADSASNGTH